MQGALLSNLDKNKMVIRVESLTGQSSGQQLVSLTPPTPSFPRSGPQTRGTLLLFNFISLISSKKKKKIIARADSGEVFSGGLKGEEGSSLQVPWGRAWQRAGKRRGGFSFPTTLRGLLRAAQGCRGRDREISGYGPCWEGAGIHGDVVVVAVAALPPDVAWFRGVTSFSGSAHNILAAEPIKPSRS